MTDINIIFCRRLLADIHAVLRQHYPHIKVRKDAWVWHAGRGHWEFHGPADFYWHGRADNAYDARHKGWNAWIEKQEVDLAAKIAAMNEGRTP
jgi:hypothetical protein